MTVTLPEGFTVNPDAADGQTACTEAQANFDSDGPAECPDQSKIGTFSIGTKALNGRLEGSVYIGEPKPGDQYRLFLIASGFGINAKLVGSVRPNLETGQVTAYFENLPQVPFDDFDLHLFAGERALMATPITCTIYTQSKATSTLGTRLLQNRNRARSLDLNPVRTALTARARCAPSPRASPPVPPTATLASFSSFTLLLNREDGDQYLGKLNFTMPPGLTANLHGVTNCPDADIESAEKHPRAHRAGAAELPGLF